MELYGASNGAHWSFMGLYGVLFLVSMTLQWSISRRNCLIRKEEEEEEGTSFSEKRDKREKEGNEGP